MRLLRHLAERHVVADPRQLVAGQAGAADKLARGRAAAPAAIRGGDRVEVALHAVVAVDLGLAQAERPPEVMDVARRGTGDPDVELDQPRIGRDHHRDRAGALGRLARGRHAVARDVGAHHERRAAVGRARGDPLDRGHHARGAAVACVLGVVDPHRRRQPEQAVDERRDRLAVVDPGLGADDQHAEPVRRDVAGGQRAAGGERGERDGVLAGLRDRHLARAEALDVLGRVDAAGPRQVLHGDVAARDGEAEGVDADAMLHGIPFAAGAGQRPAVRRGRDTAPAGRRPRGSPAACGPWRHRRAAARR